MADDNTVLVIDGIPLSPYAVRGLTQSLVPIAATLKREVNGELDDVTPSQFRKYTSVINGDDQMPPGVDGIFNGDQVTVDCLVELSGLTAGFVAARAVVPGSQRTEGLFTYYRPRLVMRVSDINVERDEYQDKARWSITLEEK